MDASNNVISTVGFTAPKGSAYENFGLLLGTGLSADAGAGDMPPWLKRLEKAAREWDIPALEQLAYEKGWTFLPLGKVKDNIDQASEDVRALQVRY